MLVFPKSYLYQELQWMLTALVHVRGRPQYQSLSCFLLGWSVFPGRLLESLCVMGDHRKKVEMDDELAVCIQNYNFCFWYNSSAYNSLWTPLINRPFTISREQIGILLLFRGTVSHEVESSRGLNSGTYSLFNKFQIITLILWPQSYPYLQRYEMLSVHELFTYSVL